MTRSGGSRRYEAVIRRRSRTESPYTQQVSPQTASWVYSGLRIAEIGPGGNLRFETGPEEVLVLPLRGSCSVTCEGQHFDLEGRESVFARVTDFAYLPLDSTVVIDSTCGCRIALPSAVASRKLGARYGPADAVPVELRGAGRASRQVNNICTPESFAADHLIVVEVLTPGGNWSSYPPHKHDEASATEAVLEEIYYFEIDNAGREGAGLAYQRVYGSSRLRHIDVCCEVANGDVILIPFGYHGPSMAAPGYDLYYLNVMAGPGERMWRFCDDPAHSWIRGTWAGQEIDPRLPLTSPAGRR